MFRQKNIGHFWCRCAQGTHPFPSRTRWLRPKRPMILCWRRHGKAGGCQDFGGVAQLGEHLPCKQGVRGSNPLISTRHRKMPKKMQLYLENYIRKSIQVIVCRHHQISNKDNETNSISLTSEYLTNKRFKRTRHKP